MRAVPRRDWRAQAPTGPAQPTPAREVFIHWTVTRPTSSAAADMRTIERIGVGRFGRTSYSFCYHPPTRTILEGAGYTIGAHTSGHNTTGVGISIIAMPGHDHMPHLATDVAAFIRAEIAAGRIVPNPTIRGHRDVKATQCPGDVAYAQLAEIRRLVNTPTTKGALMALTDAEQRELLAKVRSIDTRSRRTLGWLTFIGEWVAGKRAMTAARMAKRVKDLTP